MKLSRTLILPAFAALTLGASVAVAQGPGGQDRPNRSNPVEMFDLDGDGNITREEVDTRRTERFTNADANNDGTITFEEFTVAADAERAERMAERQQRMFERADQNGDGVLTFDETGGREDGMFERIDADGDGVITAEEREAMREQVRRRMGERDGGRSRFPGNTDDQ